MNKRHYEHTLPNIRGSLSNTYLAEKELIDKYGKLPEQLMTQNGTYRIKYQDEFNKQYDKYESLLVRLSGKNVDELFS